MILDSDRITASNAGRSRPRLAMDARPLSCRAHHIGSFLRPGRLRAAREQLVAGTLDAADFRSIENECIDEIVRYQEKLGFEIVTDGEFRRISWRSIIVERVPGFSSDAAVGSLDVARDAAGNCARIGNAPKVTVLLDAQAPIAVDDLAFLASRTFRRTKVTLPSPSYMHFLRGDRSFDESPYRDRDHYFEDLVELYCMELERLAGIGAACVQFDEVALTAICDPHVRARLRARGDDPNDLVALYASALRRILARKPRSVTIGIHMCRGNFCGKWLASGAYDYLTAGFFDSVTPDLFLLEFDSPRAGGFDVLGAITPPTAVILGLVTTKSGEVEDPGLLARRVEEAALRCDLSRLGISPQCGFASHFAGNPLTFEQQTSKLEVVTAVARAVWGQA